MGSKYQAAKLLKKQKKIQIKISTEINIKSSDEPTQFLAICNAGLTTGLQQENLLQEILKVIPKIKNIHMIPNKSYCFVECYNKDDSIKLFDEIHGKLKLGQNESILCLSYYENIPSIQKMTFEIPPGLIILNDFITSDEEKSFMNIIEIIDENSLRQSLKHRFVKHYGYEFSYKNNNVDPNKPLKDKIPLEFSLLWDRLKEKIDNLNWYVPDQLTVNIYEPGQGIPPHVDTHSAFLDPILSLSLNDSTIMEFRNDDKHYSVNVPNKSLMIMSNESRYDWSHGITPRYLDIIETENDGLTVCKRNKRISLTFRKLRKCECDCIYPKFCDTFQNNLNKNKKDLINLAENVELNNVHKVYDTIAEHFSETRHAPWPKVKEFLENFLLGDIVADIGCGNGKYLGINYEILNLGCDRSEGLLRVEKNLVHNTFKCDCLNLPIRDSSVNGVISIAVIHHLTTEERRLKAITEMVRILCKSGKGLIYVWAKNQELDNRQSSYLKRNKKINKKKLTEMELRLNNVQQKFEKSEINLPIHTNGTHFLDQDVLVPWKLKKSHNDIDGSDNDKDNLIYLRYYHVFEEGELENLCIKVKNIKIIDSFYDQGNWCIMFRKI